MSFYYSIVHLATTPPEHTVVKVPKLNKLGVVMMILSILRIYSEAVLLVQGREVSVWIITAVVTFTFCLWSLGLLLVPHFLKRWSPSLNRLPWLISGAWIDFFWGTYKSGVDRPDILVAVLICLLLLQYIGLCQCDLPGSLAYIFATYVGETPKIAVSQVLPSYKQASTGKYPPASGEAKC